MAKVSVLIEVDATNDEAFDEFEEAVRSEEESIRQAERLLEPIARLGVELEENAIPVPMFVPPSSPGAAIPPELEAFPTPETNPDLPSITVVVPARVEEWALEELNAREDVQVWAELGADPLHRLGPGAPRHPGRADRVRCRYRPARPASRTRLPSVPAGSGHRRDPRAPRRRGALGRRLPR